MKQWLKNRKNSPAIILAVAALILLTGSAAGQAIAYFTAYATAEGTKVLDLNFTTTVPKEEIRAGYKAITIQNTGDYDCYVRVKVFAGNQCQLTMGSDSDPNWTQGNDGYYYWKQILPAKAGEQISSTGTLKINIDTSKITTDSFNVIVVQECIPVPYDEVDENGNMLTWDKIDWNKTAGVVATSSELKKSDVVATSSEPKDSDNTKEVNP